jgi:hypothetical protein
MAMIQDYTTFTGNCSLPSSHEVNFVSGPNIRGTLNILWSCLSVLLICTWSILHPALPLQTNPQSKRQKIVRAFVRLLNKVAWMLFNFLGPEFSLAKAWADYKSVSSLEDGFKEFQEQDGVPWSRSHIHLANMGGFVIRFSSKNAPIAPTVEGPSSKICGFSSSCISLIGAGDASGSVHNKPLHTTGINTTRLKRSNSAPVSRSYPMSNPTSLNFNEVQSSSNTDPPVKGESLVTVPTTHQVDRHERLPQDVKRILETHGIQTIGGEIR